MAGVQRNNQLTTSYTGEKKPVNPKAANSTRESINDYSKGKASGYDIANNVVKNVSQVAAVLNKFFKAGGSKAAAATLTAAGSTYDVGKAMADPDAAVSKKLDKAIIALLDAASAAASFVNDAHKISQLESKLAGKLGYSLFAVVSLVKAFEAYKDPHMSASQKNAAYLSAGIDTATGIATLAGKAAVGYAILGAKIAFDVGNYVDQEYNDGDMADLLTDLVEQVTDDLRKDMKREFGINV
jgi:hypothetical protein